ncbi:unnamed protein product [Orchesella dallaii]|uniref:Uncharacterized protein n=1 Tax=Orchesella dallaii TaxID=48710 RepID=A0ABP1RIT8_9HEXA
MVESARARSSARTSSVRDICKRICKSEVSRSSHSIYIDLESVDVLLAFQYSVILAQKFKFAFCKKSTLTSGGTMVQMEHSFHSNRLKMLAITHPPKSISNFGPQYREVSMDNGQLIWFSIDGFNGELIDECFILASSNLVLPQHFQIVNHQYLWTPDTRWKSDRKSGGTKKVKLLNT